LQICVCLTRAHTRAYMVKKPCRELRHCSIIPTADQHSNTVKLHVIGMGIWQNGIPAYPCKPWDPCRGKRKGREWSVSRDNPPLRPFSSLPSHQH
jgi:hypothetical protein